jgi:hypothetical protein
VVKRKVKAAQNQRKPTPIAGITAGRNTKYPETREIPLCRTGWKETGKRGSIPLSFMEGA